MRAFMQSKPIIFLVSLVATICLAASFVGVGFSACAVPEQTTRFLAERYANADQSPFERDQLVGMAAITRDYTVGSNDSQLLLAGLHAINDEAHTPYEACSDLELLSAPDSYTLDAAAIAHLDDCWHVIKPAQVVLLILLALAIAAMAHLRFYHKDRELALSALVAGALVLLAFCAMGIWIALDFDAFFTVFHSLFFDDGTWTFSWDSLLISMYPTEFWIGMGAVWLATTIAFSILSIVLGLVSLKRIRKPSAHQ